MPGAAEGNAVMSFGLRMRGRMAHDRSEKDVRSARCSAGGMGNCGRAFGKQRTPDTDAHEHGPGRTAVLLRHFHTGAMVFAIFAATGRQL